MKETCKTILIEINLFNLSINYSEIVSLENLLKQKK